MIIWFLDKSRMEHAVEEFCYQDAPSSVILLWIWCTMIQYTLVNGLLQSSCALLFKLTSVMPRFSSTSLTTCSFVLSSLAGSARCAGVFGTGGHGCGDSMHFGQMLDITWVREEHSEFTWFIDTLAWLGHICRDSTGDMEDVQLQLAQAGAIKWECGSEHKGENPDVYKVPNIKIVFEEPT